MTDRKRKFVILMTALLAWFSAGCAHVDFQIESQQAPNPLFGARNFVVLPTSFEGLTVGEKSEAEYLSRKSAETAERWQDDKRGVDQEFFLALKSKASKKADLLVDQPEDALSAGEASGEPAFLVRPRVTFIEPGMNIVVHSIPAQIDLRAEILTRDGDLIDVVRLSTKTSGGYSIRQRLREGAKRLGRRTGEYLAVRVGQPAT